MFDQSEGMRHLPFFAELAALDDRDPSWREVSAGLVVLRLLDAWIEEGAAAVAADGWGLRSVEAAIEEMSDGLPTRSILQSVVKMLKSSPNDMRAVAPRLLAYGRALDLDAKWALAADVYETVIAHVHPVEESDAAIHAHVRLSYCRRQLGELDTAEQIAAQAARIAFACGDLVGALHAQIAEAKVSIVRGNYPRAEAMLDSTIERATAASLGTLRAHAIQERADVAYLKGEFEYAIKLGYLALSELTEERARDRMLNDIAGAFYKLGVRSAARDAYSLLSLTAQEQYLRWIASINLMEIAADDGSLPLFERHRREIEEAALPPLLRTQFLIHAGQGLSRLGDRAGASRMFVRAMATATEYGFNRFAFDAEEELEALQAEETAAPVELEVPPALEEIAAAIGKQRRDLAIP